MMIMIILTQVYDHKINIHSSEKHADHGTDFLANMDAMRSEFSNGSGNNVLMHLFGA